jgi:SAM-dependent methyltransferase
MPIREADWYDYPQYFDLAFRDETQMEADFFEAAFQRFCSFPVRRVLEPGCGGGRLVVEMARRGYRVTALDLSPQSVRYVQQRLARRNLTADVRQADMVQFQLPGVDAAFNTFNTFRHLLTDASASRHLQCMARHVRLGGLYILGLHLLPMDVDLESTERWMARHGQTQVNVTLRVLRADRRKRIEWLRASLYTATQLRRLLAGVPTWEIAAVFDFWYEIDHPLPLDDHITDTVLVLRRVN